MMIDRFRTFPVSAIAQLVRRISYNHIKFHVEYTLRFCGMNHFVCVCFQVVGTIVLALGCTTENTSPVLPTMLDILETHIAINVVEMDHGVFAIRKFGAIQAATGKMRGQLGDGDAVKLMLENVIRALLQIRIQRLKTLEEPFRNFP